MGTIREGHALTMVVLIIYIIVWGILKNEPDIYASEVSSVATLADPHHHFGNVHTTSSNQELLQGVKFEAAPELPKHREQVTKAIEGGTLEAFVSKDKVDFVSYEPDLLFIADTSGVKIYRLINRDFPHRFISDIKWLTRNYICFDVWTGPHYGVHYVVNATVPKVIHAVHFHDQFIEDIEKGNQQTPESASTRQ
jgi:hypothetical protein